MQVDARLNRTVGFPLGRCGYQAKQLIPAIKYLDVVGSRCGLKSPLLPRLLLCAVESKVVRYLGAHVLNIMLTR